MFNLSEGKLSGVMVGSVWLMTGWKVTEMQPHKCESPVGITATVEVKAGLKGKILAKGIDLGGWPHWRWASVSSAMSQSGGTPRMENSN